MKKFFQWLSLAAIVLSPVYYPSKTLASVNEKLESKFQLSDGVIAQSEANKFELKDFKFWSSQCLSLAEQKQYTQALTACEQAISLKPKDKNTELWSARSLSLFYIGKYAESLPSFERVVTNTPYNSSAIAYQCAALFQLDKYEDAIGKCDGALQVNGNWGNTSPSFALVYKGLALRKLGRLESALLSYKSAIAFDKDNQFAVGEFFSTLAEVGNYLYQGEKPLVELKKVIEPYEEAIKADSDKPVDIADLCLSLARTGNYNQLYKLQNVKLKNCGYQNAIAAYERASATEPSNVTILTQQGLALAQAGFYERALTSYNQAVKINPQNAFVLAQRCSILNTLEDYKSAFESCENAIASNQSGDTFRQAFLWMQRSVALAGLGKYEDALASAERAVAINPNYPPAYTARAISLWYLKSGKDNQRNNLEAEKAVQEAIQKYTDKEAVFKETFARKYLDSPVIFYRGKLLAQYNYGRILASQDKYDDAIKQYDEAYGIAKQYKKELNLNQEELEVDLSSIDKRILSNIHTNISAANLRLGKLTDAFEATLKATQINPDSFAAWYNHGLVLLNQQKYKDALFAYNQADKLSPKNPLVLTAKGIALQRWEKYSDALAVFEQVLEIEPKNFHALSGKAIALQKLSSYTEALEAFEKVLQIQPDNEYILAYQGSVLIDLKRYEEAIKVLGLALAKSPKYSYALVNKGIALENLNNNKDAIFAYEEALKLDPNNQQVKTRIAEVQKRLAISKPKLPTTKNPEKSKP